MRPVLRHAALAAACVSALVLAGCGKHVASNAPITYAPADTPYLFANFKAPSIKLAEAWGLASDSMVSMRIHELGAMAALFSKNDPTVAKVMQAVQAELANAHSIKDVAQTEGVSESPLYAIYGVGDVPVARIELASPDTFKAFWTRVEKRAGITAPTATVDNQTYWVIGSDQAKVDLLVAVEDKQLVVTVAPAKASPDMLKQLLGLTKPKDNASDRLARINSLHGYNDYGSGYLDMPKLFANLYDGKDAITQAFTKDLGGTSASPACATEFASLARQAPLLSGGFQTYTAQEIHGSLDVELSPAVLGALSALKQPVAGMGTKSDDAMYDMVLALPLKKWQAFLQGRAKAAAEKTWQCPALQSLNKFAKTAANPPVQMPPEAASVLGFRMVIDKWEVGPQYAGRMLVASSNTAALTRKIQQTLPQFALKSIPTDGRPVAFPLPAKLQAILGGGNQGWIAADSHSIVAGVGDDEEANLDDALNAPAGNGDLLFRAHMDGKMYGVLASWMSRVAAMAQAKGVNPSIIQMDATTMTNLGKVVASSDMKVKLDEHGLHMTIDARHR